MMTKAWHEIIAHYEKYDGEHHSIQALGKAARRISESQLRLGLFAWTSMFDLCIVQTEVSYPYNGPFLRLAPVSELQVEFRYVDIYDKERQWNRTIEADEVWPQFLKFLDLLRWFPADALNSVRGREIS